MIIIKYFVLLTIVQLKVKFRSDAHGISSKNQRGAIDKSAMTIRYN